MRNYTIFIIVVITSLLINCSLLPIKKSECNSRYPILFVHGIGVSDKLIFIRYWGRIPSVLELHGATVFMAKQDAWGDCRSNAIQLKKRVKEILKETGAKKVNIIAHSKGGIDSRYMISKLEMESSVASLTTLSTPHRGSKVADEIFKKINENQSIKDSLITAATIVGIMSQDETISPNAAGMSLTTTAMKKFNQEVVDSTVVYYQSYASVIDENYPALFWKKLYLYHYELEGPNDGLVSVESAQWGNYRGLITVGKHKLLSHGDVVDLHNFSGIKIQKLPEFYINLVKDLKKRGF